MADAAGPGRLFCFGQGYSADALARHLRTREPDWRLAGTTRDPGRCPALSAGGVEGFLFDRDRRLPPGALQGSTHVLVSIPPDAAGDPVLDLCREALARQRPAWIGYLSTTGVYGDSAGAWVDEDSPCRPVQDRSRRRLAAEQAWLAFGRESGLAVQIFRLAGIYGPGRSAFDALRAGRARRVDRPGHLFSRIHVDDIAAVLAASMARPCPGRIYNVCDSEPAEPAAVIAHAAGLLGMEPPPLQPFEEALAQMSAMAQSFWADNRRVRNRRIQEELGVRLAFPTYREGLRAILRAEAARGGS